MGAGVRPDLDALIAARRQALGGTTAPDDADALIGRRRAALGIPGVAAETTGVRPDYVGNKAAAAAAPAQFGTGLLRAGEQGATFGFGDELNAGARAILSDDTYGSALADERGKMQAYKEANPGTALVGELAGAVGGGALGGAVLGTAGKALGLGGKAVEASGLLTRGQRALQAAKQIGAGAAAGGVAGAGAAEGDVTDRLRAVPRGAAFGAGAVGGLKVAGTIADAVGATAFGKMLVPRAASRQTVAGRISQRAGFSTTEDLAHADILKQIARARLPLSELEAKAQGAHPDEMLMDLIGQPAVERAGGAVATPSRGSADIVEALDARMQRAPKTVREEAARGLGVQRENTVLTTQAQEAERKAAAAPLYDAAYAAPPVADPVVNEAFQLPQFQRAYTRGRRIAKAEGIDLPPIGDPYWDLSVRAIDYTKRGLDDLIDSQMRSGKMGRSEARALRVRLNSVLEKTDEAVPAYQHARRAFATGSQAIDAHEMGQSFMKAKTDELEALWPTLSDAEQQAYRQGAIASIEDAVRGKTDGFNPVKDFRDDIMRDNLRLIMPSQEAADAFEDVVTRFHGMHANRASIVGNSKTAARLAQQADAAGGVEGLGHLMGGNPVGLMNSLAKSGMAQRMRGLSESQVDALAPLLTARGAQAKAVIAALRKRATDNAARQGRVVRAIAQTTGGAGATQP